MAAASTTDRPVSKGPHERMRVLADRARIAAIPLLSLLAEIDRVEQVGTRSGTPCPRHRSEVGNGHRLIGRFAQHQVPDRRSRGPCERLQLFQGWLGLPLLPLTQARETLMQVVQGLLRALDRPREHGRLDIHTDGHNQDYDLGRDSPSCVRPHSASATPTAPYADQTIGVSDGPLSPGIADLGQPRLRRWPALLLLVRRSSLRVRWPRCPYARGGAAPGKRQWDALR